MKKITLIILTALSFILLPFVSKISAVKIPDPTTGPVLIDTFPSPQPRMTFRLNEKQYMFLEFNHDRLNTLKPMSVKWSWPFEDKMVSCDQIKMNIFSMDPVRLGMAEGRLRIGSHATEGRN